MSDKRTELLEKAVVNLTIQLEETQIELKKEKGSSSQFWKWYKEQKKEKEDLIDNCIVLRSVEIKSGFNRVKFAEGLIEQLPPEHEGRNTWLLNYGIKEEAKSKRVAKGLKFDDITQSCEMVEG